MTGFFFIVRIVAAWLLLFLLASIALNILGHDPGWLFSLLLVLTLLLVVPNAMSHVGRVRIVAGRAPDRETLGNRHRRQIEIPLDAGDAFDLVDAAMRELPRAQDIASTRDSLQVRATVQRHDPYGRGLLERIDRFGWLRGFYDTDNLAAATIAPGADASSVTLICEPDRPTWMDWLTVDHGTNLDNIESLARALTRRIAEHRRGEQAAARQTVTEKELTVAKLSLLHAQVEPHFLYNTLASAQLLTRSDPARADVMLGHLITYLRRSLPRTEQTLSTLGEELERANAYLGILAIRMGDRLSTRVDVPAPLHGLPFPPMMLQTLVENAIKHGLEPKPGGGTIWILARADERRLSVTVADDGAGLSAQSSGTGIGLKNVRERLRLVYGAGASLDLVANFPSGVAATIVVPVTAPIDMEGERHAA